MSQEEFAIECQLDRSYYGQIERGEQNVTIKTAHKIAMPLGITLSDLFAEIDNPSSETISSNC